MSEKRKDTKGRILREGESQDKNPDSKFYGRYRYRHKQRSGNIVEFYSWKLEETDKLPKGKRDCEALRTQIRRAEEDERRGISNDARRTTVYDICSNSIEKKSVKATLNTLAMYKTVMKTIREDPFSCLTLDKVNKNAVEQFFIRLNKNGKGHSSLRNIKGVLNGAFSDAYDNHIIQENIIPKVSITELFGKHRGTRQPVQSSNKEAFLTFVAESKVYKKYLDSFIILFETGMRVSEFCGLTFDDVHLDEGYISINHILQKARDGHLYVNNHGDKATGKTENAERIIPLSPAAIEAFKRVFASRPKLNKEIVVDGYSGFIFINNYQGICRPVVAYDVQHHLKHAIDRYNKTHGEDAQIEPFTPHCCRHTFCTDLFESKAVNVKSIQYVMGHALSETTLDIYAHSNRSTVMAEFDAYIKQREK